MTSIGMLTSTDATPAAAPMARSQACTITQHSTACCRCTTCAWAVECCCLQQHKHAPAQQLLQSPMRCALQVQYVSPAAQPCCSPDLALTPPICWWSRPFSVPTPSNHAADCTYPALCSRMGSSRSGRAQNPSKGCQYPAHRRARAQHRRCRQGDTCACAEPYTCSRVHVQHQNWQPLQHAWSDCNPAQGAAVMLWAQSLLPGDSSSGLPLTFLRTLVAISWTKFPPTVPA